MKKVDKSILIKSLNSQLLANTSIFVVNYAGVDSVLMQSFRSELRKIAGVKFLVTKNTFIELAIKGTDFDAISSSLVGQNGIIVTSDSVSVAKVIQKFCRPKGFKFVTCFDSGTLGDMAYIKFLSDLSDIATTRSRLLSVMNFVGSSFVRTLNEPAICLVRACNARSEKN